MNSVSFGSILKRLQGVSRRYRHIISAESLVTAGIVGIWLTVLCALYESFLYLAPPFKQFLVLAVLGATVAAFLVYIVIQSVRRPGIEDIARMVERTYPQLGDRLISAVQLGGLEGAALKGQSRSLVDALLHVVDSETEKLNLLRSVSTRWLSALARVAYGSLITALFAALLFPGHMLGGLYRLIDYSHEYSRPGGTFIYTLGLDGSIIRGDDYRTKGFVSAGNGETLSILYRWEDSDTWSVKPVTYDEKTGAFTVVVEKPRTSFRYYLEMGSYATPRHRITVIERPDVVTLALFITYPGYTGLGTVTRDDNDGNVRLPEGSNVSITVKSNKPLYSMALNWSDSTVTDCSVTGAAGTGSFTVARDLDYYIGLVDTLGITNTNPISYRVTCLKDENPAVTILSPVSDIVLPRVMRFPIVYRARDDFGISSIRLSYRLPYEKKIREVMLRKNVPERDIINEYLWDLSKVNLLPEDTISYFITVYDNDMVKGPKKGISETRMVRVPSVSELMSELAARQDSGITKLRDMSERTLQQNKELDDLRRNIMSGKEMDWSEKNELKETTGSLENMQQNLKDLSETIRKTAELLSEEDIVTLETLEKMNKISTMMDELADGPMKEALKRLAEAASQIDPEKINDALKNFEISSEAIKEKLDRFINLLEKLMTIQRFEMARKVLEDIAFRQSQLSERFKQDGNASKLVHEQEMLGSEMKNLEKELMDVAGRMKEHFSIDTEPLTSKIADNAVSGKMNETAAQFGQGKNAEAGQNLQELTTQLSDLLKTMDTLDASLKSRNTAELKKRLFKAATALLAVSQKQEQLLGDIGSTDTEELAKQELEIIDGLQKSRQYLVELSSIFVEVTQPLDMLMESARMSAGTALDALASGSAAGGKDGAVNTLSSINKTVHFLTLLLSSSPEGGQIMPGDLMSQLQQIASGQLSLNMQMQSGMSVEMLARLAAEQQKLAQMLSELSNKLATDKQLQEMLDKIVEDMDDTSNMMSMNKERELVERKQLDIYRRLLDAKRSRREKDEENERKSWTAKKDVSIGADELAADRGERKRELNERIKRAMEDDFNPEYRRLIRRYFESMLEDNVEVIGR